MIEAGRRTSILVGALVVVVAAVLAAIIIFLGSATRVFSRNVHVSACFRDVTGLRSGASVLRAGVSIGAVGGIKLDPRCGGAARVDLALDVDAAHALPADSRAKLVTMGLLGDQLIALEPGRAGEQLRGGEVLEGVVPPDANAVIAQAGEAFDVLQRIATRLDQQLAAVDLGAAFAEVLQTNRSLRDLFQRAEHGPGLLHTLLFDRALDERMRAIGPAMQGAATAAGNAARATAELDHVATDMRQIVGYVKSGQGTLGGIIYDPAIYEDLRTIVGGVRRNVILRTLGRFVLKHH